MPLAAGENRVPHLASQVVAADLLRKAVIRGDLAAARREALRLAAIATAPDMAPGSPALTTAFGDAARAAADAQTLAQAGADVARVAAACGACHRSSGVHAALRTSPASRLGGVVGHMKEHELAADQLHAALVEPSDEQWRQGAEALTAAPLKRSLLPRDPHLTDAVFAAEQRTHDLAARAAGATTLAERVEIYGRLLAACADCHRLHERIWGPGEPR
jgi:hypothetical protein